MRRRAMVGDKTWRVLADRNTGQQVPDNRRHPESLGNVAKD